MHAEICVVCCGKGKIGTPEIICHGCDGKGWIEVLNGNPFPQPIPIPIYPCPIPWIPYYIPPTLDPYYWKPIITCDTSEIKI